MPLVKKSGGAIADVLKLRSIHPSGGPSLINAKCDIGPNRSCLAINDCQRLLSLLFNPCHLPSGSASQDVHLIAVGYFQRISVEEPHKLACRAHCKPFSLLRPNNEILAKHRRRQIVCTCPSKMKTQIFCASAGHFMQIKPA